MIETVEELRTALQTCFQEDRKQWLDDLCRRVYHTQSTRQQLLTLLVKRMKRLDAHLPV